MTDHHAISHDLVMNCIMKISKICSDCFSLSVSLNDPIIQSQVVFGVACNINKFACGLLVEFMRQNGIAVTEKQMHDLFAISQDKMPIDEALRKVGVEWPVSDKAAN